MVASRRKQPNREERAEQWRAQHEAELEHRRSERSHARLEKRLSAHPQDYVHADALFEAEMATRLNLSIAEFRQIQQRRRSEMGGVGGNLVYSPNHEVH